MNGRIIPLSLPKWGLLMTEGTLVSWRAAVGARLAAGDPVADIESEKIVNELETHEPGILRRQLVQAGETCPVGALIGVMTEGDVSDADIDAFIRRTAITAHHPCGTCAMGIGPQAVTDPQLRVRGAERLRVVDASVMPDLVSAHINACVLMIAEKAADMILGKPPLPADLAA